MIERIKLILQAKNISVAQFAEDINVQRSRMSHILSGRNRPSLDFVIKVLKCYPEINPSWLILGEGEMYTGGVKEKEQLNLFSADDMSVGKEVSEPDPAYEIKSNTTGITEPNNVFNDAIINTQTILHEQKTIERVMIFYTDKTFVEYKKG